MEIPLFASTVSFCSSNSGLLVCCPISFATVNASRDFAPEASVPVIMDTVYTFAHALHRLRSRHCASATGSQLHVCVRKHNFLRFVYPSAKKKNKKKQETSRQRDWDVSLADWVLCLRRIHDLRLLVGSSPDKGILESLLLQTSRLPSEFDYFWPLLFSCPGLFR